MRPLLAAVTGTLASGARPAPALRLRHQTGFERDLVRDRHFRQSVTLSGFSPPAARTSDKFGHIVSYLTILAIVGIAL